MKKFLFFLLFLFVFTWYVPKVFAHVLEVDGSIGAVLHIDPEDDPIAGQPSNFFLQFKDKNNNFTSTNCYCRIDILQHGKVIYSDALFQQSLNKNTDTAYDSFTFPGLDVYQLQVIGTPRTDHIFQAFTLTYTIRVDRDSGTSTNSSQNTSWLSTHVIHLLIGIGILFLSVIAMIQKTIKKRRSVSAKGGVPKQDEEITKNTY